MTGGRVERTDRAVRKFSSKGVPVRLPKPAPLAAPAQTSGVNQAPIYGDTITKPGFGGVKTVLQCGRRGKAAPRTHCGSAPGLAGVGHDGAGNAAGSGAGGSTFTVPAMW